jgi:integrase
MSVYQLTHRGRKLWCSDLRMEGGKRHMNAQWLKRDAEAFEAKKLLELRNFGAKGALSDEDRRELLHIKDQAAKLGVNVLDALKFWAAHNRQLVPKPIGKAVDAYMAFLEQANYRDSYLKPLRWALNNLAGHVGPEVAVNALTFAMVDKWAGSRNWGLGSRYRRFGDVRAFLSWCRSPGTGEHWLVRNPMDDMPKIRLDHKPPAILSVAECKSLLNFTLATDLGMVPFLVVQLFGGMRVGEAHKIFMQPHGNEERTFRPEWISVEDRHAKRTRARYNNRKIPLSDNPTLRLWLEAMPPAFPITNWSYRWDRIHQGSKVPRNAIRHTAATFTLHKYGEIAAAARLGHSIDVLHTRYKGELDDPEDGERFWNLLPVFTLDRKLSPLV